MTYRKQTWRDYDDTKTEHQNRERGAVVTPERLNHIETGIANSADKQEVTAQLAQTKGEINALEGNKVGGGVLAGIGDLSQEVKESMTGGSVAVVGKGAVTLDTLANDTRTRIENIANETNMKNTAILKPGILYINSLEYNLHSSYPNAYVYFIRVRANKNYKIKVEEKEATILRNTFAFFKELPKDGVRTFSDEKVNDSIIDGTFNYKPDENGYLALYFTNTGADIDFLMLDDEKTMANVRLKKDPITISDTDFIRPSEYNLYNESNTLEGILFYNGYYGYRGTQAPYDPFEGQQVVYVEIEPGKQYVIKPQDTGDGLINFTRYAVFIDLPVEYERTQPHRLINERFTKEEITFTNDDVGRYLLIYLSNNSDGKVAKAQVNEGSKANEYRPFGVKIFNTDLTSTPPLGGEANRVKLYGNFNKIFNYDTEENILDDLPDPENAQVSDIYGLYDTLETQYPNTLSKRLIGYGSTAEGTEDTSLPIYEYTLKPPNNINMNTNREEKLTYSGDVEYSEILLAAGTHGNEKMTVYALYKFIKNLIENNGDETLASIRDNSLIRFVPIVNVSGYELNTYENANGVNLNRNYTDGPSKDGTEPYSEHETKAMREFFTSNPDADIYIDLHTFRGREGANQVSYHYSFNDDVNKLYATFMRRMSNDWKDRVIHTYVENEALGYSESEFSKNATSYREAYYVYGIEYPSLLEFGDGIPDHPSYSDGLIKIGVELITNYISSMLGRYFT